MHLPHRPTLIETCYTLRSSHMLVSTQIRTLPCHINQDMWTIKSCYLSSARNCNLSSPLEQPTNLPGGRYGSICLLEAEFTMCSIRVLGRNILNVVLCTIHSARSLGVVTVSPSPRCLHAPQRSHSTSNRCSKRAAKACRLSRRQSMACQ